MYGIYHYDTDDIVFTSNDYDEIEDFINGLDGDYEIIDLDCSILNPA